MPFDELSAYALAIAGITVIIVQIINSLWIGPSKLGADQKAAALRGINYLINLTLILVVLFTHNAFVVNDLLMYLALAFGQSLGSHAGYSIVSNESGGGPPDSPMSGHMTAPPTVPPLTPGL